VKLEPLVVTKEPGRRFTPRGIANIRAALSSFGVPPGTSVDSLYDAIVDIFTTHSPVKTSARSNEAESWMNLIPSDLRYKQGLVT
jgi:hypothetical protein